jgi:hypothetical protein
MTQSPSSGVRSVSGSTSGVAEIKTGVPVHPRSWPLPIASVRRCRTSKRISGSAGLWMLCSTTEAGRAAPPVQRRYLALESLWGDFAVLRGYRRNRVSDPCVRYVLTYVSGRSSSVFRMHVVCRVADGTHRARGIADLGRNPLTPSRNCLLQA